MNFPGQYRPTCTSDDVRELLQSLRLPEPGSISFPTSQGALNQIVVLEWPEQTLKDILNTCNVIPQSTDSSTSLLLRIASGEVPNVKLENEAATLLWVAANTSIPVPRIVHHDSTTTNPLQHEYAIMTYSNGLPGSIAYPNLTNEKMDYILDQLADHILQLYQKPFDCVAGLKTTSENQVVPGPVVDESQWTMPEIEKNWPTTTKYEDLTPVSPNGFSSFTEYLTERLQCYIRATPAHPALQSLPYLSRTNIQLLEQFIEVISKPEQAAIINDTTYILAHRDLHFGQLLLDPDTAQINAVLDWEFAAIIPAPLWQGGFLWNGNQAVPWSEEIRVERALLRQRWEARVRLLDGGEEMLKESVWKHKSQEAAYEVVNLMRCIVEVVPRGVQLDDARRWWGEIVHALRVLGIGTKNEQSQTNSETVIGRVPFSKPKQRPDAVSEADAKKEISEPSSGDDVASLAIHDMLADKPMKVLSDQI